MSDLVIRTRPAIDIPLAVIAIGLTLLLAFTVRGSLATPASAPTQSPVASPTTTVAPAQLAPPKDKGKGHD